MKKTIINFDKNFNEQNLKRIKQGEIDVHGQEDSILSRCSSSRLDLQFQHNPSQNPSKLFCGYQQTDSKVYTEKVKTENT